MCFLGVDENFSEEYREWGNALWPFWAECAMIIKKEEAICQL